MSLKDLSIMMTLSISSHKEGSKIISSQRFDYNYKIKAVDLDLKDVEKIPYHYETHCKLKTINDEYLNGNFNDFRHCNLIKRP